MFGFNYYTPTKVVFGKGTENEVADLVKEFGGKKVLVHYGGGSVVRSGLHACDGQARGSRDPVCDTGRRGTQSASGACI